MTGVKPNRKKNLKQTLCAVRTPHRVDPHRLFALVKSVIDPAAEVVDGRWRSSIALAGPVPPGTGASFVYAADMSGQRSIESVAVLGCGTMGSGIAAASAEAGCRVLMLDVSPEAVERGLQAVDEEHRALVDTGTLVR